MRDTHEGMPEIIDAFEKEGRYFGIIGIELDGIYKKFQFGISQTGYRALRKNFLTQSWRACRAANISASFYAFASFSMMTPTNT